MSKCISPLSTRRLERVDLQKRNRKQMYDHIKEDISVGEKNFTDLFFFVQKRFKFKNKLLKKSFHFVYNLLMFKWTKTRFVNS